MKWPVYGWSNVYKTPGKYISLLFTAYGDTTSTSIYDNAKEYFLFRAKQVKQIARFVIEEQLKKL